jgi:glycosyltransferase involved in cell wall biosynthesis
MSAENLLSVSIVIPIYNESGNIRPLCHSVQGVLSGTRRAYEIILVDDGSDDGSAAEMEQVAQDNAPVRVITLRGNFGQSAALCAGIQAARYDVVVTMDGDRQNDPQDIPLLVAKLEEGYDLVHGWRKDRKDPFWNRRLPSLIANWTIARATGFPVHDLGCTLKAIRREIAQEIELYGELHRFIPILAHRRGARCAEVVTRHHPRRIGKSKYGIARVPRVLLDLVTVKYLMDDSASPMRTFGSLALGCGFVGGIAAVATVAMKVLDRIDMTGNPLLILSTFSWMLAPQFFAVGMLGELGRRIYFTAAQQRPYVVRQSTTSAEDTTRTLPTSAKKAA